MWMLVLWTAWAGVSFEVASVRANRTAEGARQGGLFREHISTSEGRVTLRNISLQACIKWAYGVQDPQIVGPDWIKVERYDIAAKASGPATEDELREMLRTLLAERFGLVVRRETRRLPAVVLTARREMKLRVSLGEGAGTIQAGRGKIVAIRTAISELAAVLSDPLRMPVVDETGLGGRYDFTLDFTAFAPAPGDPGDEMTATVTVVQQQLGLKLESRRIDVGVLVVEHADKVPTAN